jgi:putative membrane protein
MREEVLTRAQQVFYLNRVHRTAGATGMLIYVSLFERMAAVIGDQTVVEQLGHGTLQELCDTLTADLRITKPPQALSTAIRAVGDRLAPVLPRAEDDVNELSDALVVLD